MHITQPFFYTTEEVSEILHLHVKTVRDLIRKKKLNAIQIGSEYRISDDHLTEFIKNSEVRKETDEKEK